MYVHMSVSVKYVIPPLYVAKFMQVSCLDLIAVGVPWAGIQTPYWKGIPLTEMGIIH